MIGMGMPKRWEIYHYGLEKCGITFSSENLALALTKRGIEATTRAYGRNSRDPDEAAVAIFNIEMGRSARNPLGTLEMLRRLLVRRILRKRSCTIVHVVYTRSELRRILGAGLGELFEAYQFVLLQLVSRLGKIVVLQESPARRLEEIGIVARVIVYGAYLNDKKLNTVLLRKRWRAENQELALGFLGHPIPFKRYSQFIRCILNVGRERRANLRLIYVGGEGARAPAEWKTIVSLLEPELGDTCFILQDLSDEAFAEAVEALDLCVIPYSGLAQDSGVLSSAASAGVPCLVSQSTTFDTVVDAGGAARLADESLTDGNAILQQIDKLDLGKLRASMQAFAEKSSMLNAADEFVKLLLD